MENVSCADRWWGAGMIARMRNGRDVRERRLALGLALVTVVIWGLSFVATRVAVQTVPPLTLAFLRFLIATVLLLGLVRHRYGRIGFTPRDRWDVVWMGLTGVTLAFVFENVGLRHTSASHGALLVSLTPLATAAAEAALGRSRMGWRTLAGLLAALGGVLLIVGAGGGGATLYGDLLMLATVGCWVAYSFLTERLTGRYPAVAVTAWSIAAGTAALLPLAVVELLREGIGRPGTEALLATLYLGVLCSAVAYVWWNRAINVLGVTVTNALIYGIPLVGVLAGVVMLGEPLTWKVAAGAVLIVGGVVIATQTAEPAPAPRA